MEPGDTDKGVEIRQGRFSHLMDNISRMKCYQQIYLDMGCRMRIYQIYFDYYVSCSVNTENCFCI